MVNRCIVIVLDSFGVGEAPDSKEYNDEGSNTLVNIYNNTKLSLPNMKKMGLYNIDGIEISEKEINPIGAYGKAMEVSKGKDTTTGHWEMAGVILNESFDTFKSFTDEIIEEFIEKTGVGGVLGNCVASGTEIIPKFSAEHEKTGYPIVYTSVDSVFQIAMHEEVILLERQYEICKIARDILNRSKYNVGRVICRPYIGRNGNYTRTKNRHDFSTVPPEKTMLDVIKENNLDVCAVGKISDIFAGIGVTQSVYIQSNMDGVDKTIDFINQNNKGLIFTNLVDFDMLYGHRNDIEGYAKALEEFDSRLPEIFRNMNENDILIITADHGCDPSTPSIDHSREYIPILVYGKNIKANVNLKTRNTFADISATVLDILNLPSIENGSSFKEEILA
jgi:phosphopentomutase